MSEYNIQMNKYNALNAEYDQLYPATKIANVDGLDTALQNKADLGEDGKVPESQLPSMGYSKSETLSDTTKTLFGLGSDAVPDDALAVLSRFHKGMGSEYVWVKHAPTYTEETFTDRDISGQYASGKTKFYADSFHVDNGYFVLNNPKPLNITSDNWYDPSIYDVLTGKFFMDNTSRRTSVFKAAPTATYRYDGEYIRASEVSIMQNPGVDTTNITYVNSPNPNAYPIDDGYTYTALGQFGSAARVEILTYTGADQTTKTITFSNTPKIVLIFTNRNNTTYYVPSVYVWGYPRIFKAKTGASGTSYNGLSETYYMVKATTSGNSLTLEYTTDPSYNLFNGSFETYTVVAIG